MDKGVFVRLVHHELKVCLRGWWFWAALLVACALACVSAVEAMARVSDYMGNYQKWFGWGAEQRIYDGWGNLGSYANWIVPNANASMFAEIFFTVLPLLVTIPFAWSYHADRMSGYGKALRACAGSRRYIAAKTIATFASGFLIACVPLVLNFLVLSCVLPPYVPEYETWMVLGIFDDMLFSWQFYNYPLGYVVAFTLLDGVLMGVWSVFVLAMSRVFGNRFSVLILPYFMLLIWQYLSSYFVPDMLNIQLWHMNVIDDMRGTTYGSVPDIRAIVVEITFMAGVSAVCLRSLCTRDVI